MPKRNKCFVNAHCCYDCPDFQRQAADEKYGVGIADDMGFNEIKCKDCYLNTGECKDCLLENSPECPKYGRDKNDKS